MLSNASCTSVVARTSIQSILGLCKHWKQKFVKNIEMKILAFLVVLAFCAAAGKCMHSLTVGL